MKKKKIVVAMSGGVDSSVAAHILKQEGHELIGVFLHFWKDSGTENSGRIENKCCSLEALMDARRVCRKVGMPLYTMNFSGEFKEIVVDNFLSEYRRGNTPNPCVQCNKFVKLGLLIQKARELGFDFVASGHYVRVKSQKSKVKSQLFKGVDDNKDQSYFLYKLNQEQLKHLIFPLGKYTKDEVREMAERAGLPVAQKSESQEICFIPGKDHNQFLQKYLKLKNGPIKTFDGEVLGEHRGLPLYTIGQRRGIEIGGIGPFYAARMDYQTNSLYVVDDANDERLFSDGLIVEDVNWISGSAPVLPFVCGAVIRYRHKPAKCQITKNNNGEYEVRFEKPQRAVTPGQSVVFYDGDEVLGGGIIGRCSD